MSRYLMDCFPLIVFLSVILIVFVDASSGPKLKVNFGLNLPGLSFKLPSMSLPKMKITAVIARSQPKRPMRIQLPSISLHAKSLEDTWGNEGGGNGGGGYDNGYSNQGEGNNYGNNGGNGNGGGWSNNGGGNNIDEGKPYETAYASSNEEEFVDPHDEDNFEENEEDQSETNPQYDQEQPSIDNQSNQSVNYTESQPIAQPQSPILINTNDYKSNNGFYQMNPMNNYNQQIPDKKSQEKSTNHGQINQPIYATANPIIMNQENTNQLNHGPPKYNQYALASPLPSNDNRNNDNLLNGGQSVNHGYRQFIVKLPHNFQLPHLPLNDNRYNGQQQQKFNGNDNDNYIHKLPYLKQFIVSNEPMQLTPNALVIRNNQNVGFKPQQQSTNQPDFSKRSMFNQNYYRYAIVA
ncbi:putative mediator of RNA polymerase II transcription subunit 26 [Panonychus citri]|uniref:putative mediator of RNA polymerase II transcription subunit 26 n=1 Tax=Panonychus citri TaxID=50023 RepID=UPI00230826D8|nr:putative mediator of RNA polymerase II transcription subunit 26 [Panonychus citri]